MQFLMLNAQIAEIQLSFLRTKLIEIVRNVKNQFRMIVKTTGAVSGVHLHLLIRGIIVPSLNGQKTDLTDILSKGPHT